MVDEACYDWIHAITKNVCFLLFVFFQDSLSGRHPHSALSPNWIVTVGSWMMLATTDLCHVTEMYVFFLCFFSEHTIEKGTCRSELQHQKASIRYVMSWYMTFILIDS
jgi:hypothetical protein